jgi:hypothetical protein
MTLSSKDVAAFLKRYPIAIGCGVLSVILLAGSYVRSDRTVELVKQSKEGEEQGKKILKDIRDGANLAEQYETLAGHTKELESRLVHSSERARNQQYFYRIESEPSRFMQVSAIPFLSRVTTGRYSVFSAGWSPGRIFTGWSLGPFPARASAARVARRP